MVINLARKYVKSNKIHTDQQIINIKHYVDKKLKELKYNKKTLCVITIGIICSNLASLRKFQYFRRPIYNSIEHL